MSEARDTSFPPLRILVLFHPESPVARDHALGIYRRFMAIGGGRACGFRSRLAPISAMRPAAPARTR